MTPKQRKLARHALGLPNAKKQSFRNRFEAAQAPCGDFEQWARMEAQGLARRDTSARASSTTCLFWLTRTGAKAVLNKGETLCPEDFPN